MMRIEFSLKVTGVGFQSTPLGMELSKEIVDCCIRDPRQLTSFPHLKCYVVVYGSVVWIYCA